MNPWLTRPLHFPANKCLLSKCWCLHVNKLTAPRSAAAFVKLSDSLSKSNNRTFQPQRDLTETDKCTPAFSSWQAGETCGGSMPHLDGFSLWDTSRAFIFRYLGFPHTITQPWTFESKLRSWKLLVHFQVGTEHFSPLDVSAQPTLITNKQTHQHWYYTPSHRCVLQMNRAGGCRWVVPGNLDLWHGSEAGIMSKQLIKCY